MAKICFFTARNLRSPGLSALLLGAALVFAACSNPAGGGGGNGPVLIGIEVGSAPAKTGYVLNEAFEPAGLAVRAVYDNGNTADLGAGDYTLSWDGGEFADITIAAGVKTVTVAYGEYTGTFTITVDLVLDHIDITSPPTKTAYVEGALFTSAGLVVTAVYDNSDTAVIGAADYTFSWDGGAFADITAAAGTKTVTVTHRDKTNTFTITVTPPDTTPPGDISGLGGTANSGQVTLTWTDPADGDLDCIEITWTPGGTTPQTVTGGLQTKTITGLDNGTAYTFTLTAVDTSGNRSGGVNTAALTPALDLSVIAAALDAGPGGGSAASPVTITTDVINTQADWTALLSLLGTKGKYAALDLSACGITGTFDPGTANTGEKYIASLVLPDTVTGTKYTVSPSDAAFRYFTSLRNIEGANVRNIEAYAFYNRTTLKTVNFPAATGISSYAFAGCTALETADFPAVKYGFGFNAFQGCTSLVSVSSQTATSIYNYTFAGCTSLKTVYLPAVTNIPNDAIYAFQGCTALETVDLSSAAGIIGEIFRDCTLLKTVDLSSLTYLGYSTFRGCTSLESIDLPAVTYIGGDAFRGCTALETVNIPAVTQLDLGVFKDCTALETINLPATLTTIDGNPFIGCTGLTTVTIAPANPAYQTQNNMLLNKAGDTLIGYFGGANASSSTVTTIAGYAFYGRTTLQSVSFPLVTTIGSEAFYGCTTLQTINLPAAKTIDYGAFTNCDVLETLNLPAAETIGDSAFTSCNLLKTISLPAAETIGNGAFRWCDMLKTVTLSSAVSIAELAFSSCTALETISLPAATSIGRWAFSDCTALKTVNLPAAVSIGEEAFRDTVLQTVNLPVVTSIGNQAFRTRSAVSLTVTLPKAAPAMSYSGLNSSYYYTKTVTIKTPAGKTGYNTTWENNFKSSFYPYYVSDITLNYAVLP